MFGEERGEGLWWCGGVDEAKCERVIELRVSARSPVLMYSLLVPGVFRDYLAGCLLVGGCGWIYRMESLSIARLIESVCYL